MKLSSETMEILNNFSTINPSIVLRAGNVIRTGTPDLSVFAKATIKESFDREVGIYNLKRFLGVMSLFDGETDVVLTDSVIQVTNDRQFIDYILGDRSLIKAVPDKDPNVPAAVAEFDLKWADLATALKAVSLLDVPNVIMSGDGSKITLSVADPKNSSKDKYRVIIGESSVKFSTKLLKTSFKMMPRDYRVSAHEAYAKFESPDVTYWLPAAAE